MTEFNGKNGNGYQPEFCEVDVEQLKKFYGVSTDLELIAIQSRSIKRLHERLNERPRSFPMPPTRFA